MHNTDSNGKNNMNLSKTNCDTTQLETEFIYHAIKRSDTRWSGDNYIVVRNINCNPLS